MDAPSAGLAALASRFRKGGSGELRQMPSSLAQKKTQNSERQLFIFFWEQQ
ncbi:hypothetical protein [Moheibacter sediminis]|uniref:hypothetical protein n=1 Tax=Moheibacter sediminis TaxID=1434700 RepID=UPI00135668AA|nr:hypothetical protein [Moheibacter sediminis]